MSARGYEAHNAIDDLEGEIEEMEGRVNSLLKMTYKLYISKISLSPQLFEQELNEYFKNTIDKRL